uniref:uncharacterized protein LOC105349508 n=1 Tax=Fragaria vesca subsp. vesca TaxID=101020 RepID=UPI0005C8A940|nr:PREDICTED: uncharacterized protein LOC105349508 [Fragaria vesca subsp. vesca]
MVIVGKRKDRATKAGALMESIQQSVGSASSSNHPSPMPADTVPPAGPPLIVRPVPVDTTSTGSPSSTSTPESTRRIVGSARLKVRNPTAPAPKKKQGFCSRKKAEDIVAQTGQKIKLQYCPRVKGPSVRGINSLVAHDIGSVIRSLVGMRARTFYDLDQVEKWKVWNALSKTMHHHTGSSPIIYTMEKLRIQGEQLPIIKGFEKTYVRAGDEDTTKKYNDMVDEVNKRKDAFKEQHPDTTEEEIMESVQSQQIEVLGTVLKTRKGKEIRGMGRGGERDLSQSSNGSTSRSRPPRVDEQQLQEMQERYEQRLKESEERAQQQYQEAHQHALLAKSMYSAVQSQFAAIYERLGMPPPPPPQIPPPPPVVSPPHFLHKTMMI